MQLTTKLAPGSGLRRGLALAAGLLTGTSLEAQESENPPTTTIDSGLLVYHEVGRVDAIEPDISLSQKIDDDSTLTFGFTADALTGATPLGAVPSNRPQTYMRPYKLVPLGTPVTTTTASGGSTVVLIPPASGATSQTFSTSSTVAANTYPLQRGFSDRRLAGHLGWQQALTSTLKLDLGGAYSKERDYRSESAHAGLSQDLFGHNTTLSGGINYQSDLSFPIGGTPTPLALMSGDWKGPPAPLHEIDGLLGITQVMSRRWLSTLSYSYSRSQGDETDPYKLISVVDPGSGEPLQQIYESRPRSRTKQALYFDNKIHLPNDIISLSLRGYQDDWGIHSVTADLRYRLQLGPDFYVEPHLRYYQQSAANFYHDFLLASAILPQYASADTRLARFHALTYGLKLGMNLSENSEINLRVEYYDQRGNGFPANAVGQLKQQNLFPDLKALTLLLGNTYAF